METKKVLTNKTTKGLMKKILILAAAATMLVACAETEKLNNDLRTNDAPRVIGFGTISEKATRANVENLEVYHQTFAVWSTKKSSNNGAVEKVFEGDSLKDIITYDETKMDPNHWTYKPYRYWDKQAVYSFVAVAPNASIVRYNNPADVADNGGTYTTTNAAGYTLVGQNLQTTDAPAQAEIKKGFTGGEGKDTDIMTAGKITRDGAATIEDVNLGFKHILAKLNVSIAKDPIYDNVKVIIDTVIVSGLDDNGTYNEATSGTTSGWTSSKVNNDYKLSWINASGVELLNGEGQGEDYVAGKPLYFIESLVMPQSIEQEAEKLFIGYRIVSGDHTEKYNYQLYLQDSVGYKVFDNFMEKNNYTIKLTVKPNVITFDASTDVWNDILNEDNSIIPPVEP
jgi:hypothetical protein